MNIKRNFKEQKEPVASITQADIMKSVYFLSKIFEEKTAPFRTSKYSQKGDQLYNHEIEIMWRLHDIKMGPRYRAPMVINECEKYIKEIEILPKVG
jgi:hypothetical protein